MPSTRASLHRHTQCAWCGKLKHRNGRPHGRAFDPHRLANLGYSHGACTECLPGLLREPAQSASVVECPGLLSDADLRAGWQVIGWLTTGQGDLVGTWIADMCPENRTGASGAR